MDDAHRLRDLWDCGSDGSTFATICGVGDDLNSVMFISQIRNFCGGPIRRTIIDDDDLTHHWLEENALDRFGNRRLLIEGWY